MVTQHTTSSYFQMLSHKLSLSIFCSLTFILPAMCICLIDDLFVSIKCVREFTPHQQLTYAYENITQNAPTGKMYSTLDLDTLDT